MAGANLLYLGAIGAGVMAAAWLMVTSTPYQLQRVQCFLDPFRDPLGARLQHDPGSAWRSASVA